MFRGACPYTLGEGKEVWDTIFGIADKGDVHKSKDVGKRREPKWI